MDAFLQVVGLSISFGGLHAVSDVNFQMDRGEIVGIIGPNGAGKTTLFNLLTGFLRPTRGEVIFKGQNIVGKKPHRVVDCGIARTFQIVRPFQQLSVLDNIVIPLQCPKSRKLGRNRIENQREAARILGQVGLADKLNLVAGEISHGDLRRLEVARSLATGPDLLLLDEPFSGLAAMEIETLSSLIVKLNNGGLSIIIIEHKLREMMRLVKRVITLNFGVKIADGTPEEIARDESVIKAYLGKGGEKFVTS
jgi:branched-chain amino acid transport system ATP-binding protein